MDKMQYLTDAINNDWEVTLLYKNFKVELINSSYTSKRLGVSIRVNDIKHRRELSLNTTHPYNKTYTKGIVESVIKEMQEYIFKEEEY